MDPLSALRLIQAIPGSEGLSLVVSVPACDRNDHEWRATLPHEPVAALRIRAYLGSLARDAKPAP